MRPPLRSLGKGLHSALESWGQEGRASLDGELDRDWMLSRHVATEPEHLAPRRTGETFSR